MKKLLGNYGNNRKLNEREVRILQGVFMEKYGTLEHVEKQDKALKKEKANLRRQNSKLSFIDRSNKPNLVGENSFNSSGKNSLKRGHQSPSRSRSTTNL